MAALSIEKQQRLYDTLKKIARQYMTPAQIARDADRTHGALDRLEYLEMAYENIQGEAKAAIKGLRRPEKAHPPPAPSQEGASEGEGEDSSSAGAPPFDHKD